MTRVSELTPDNNVIVSLTNFVIVSHSRGVSFQDLITEPICLAKFLLKNIFSEFNLAGPLSE